VIPVIALAAGIAMAQIAPGDVFPELKGEYLSGGIARMPADSKGRAVLLAFGFSLDSLDPIQLWIFRFLQDYDHHPKVVSFDVPMLAGVAKMGKGVIEANIRKVMIPASHRHVIVVASKVGVWKKRLGFGSPKHAYLVLFDRDGVVRWRHSGMFDESKYAELNQAIRGLIE
jgi:hypothetical protein